MQTSAIQAAVGETHPVAETKVRTVRVDDELWKMAQEKAKRRRETVAAVIKRALLAYVEED
jgi:predicted transcriptional regulator